VKAGCNLHDRLQRAHCIINSNVTLWNGWNSESYWHTKCRTDRRFGKLASRRTITLKYGTGQTYISEEIKANESW